MSQNNQASDLAQVISLMLEYMRDKGQLPHLDKFLLLKLYQKALEERFNIPEIVNWDDVIRYSINSPPLAPPLWLKAISSLANINNRTEIVQQTYRKKPLLGD